MTEDPRYTQYFQLFHQEKFFEAHEVLEALWKETHGAQREFYQGLIQIAAALVHLQKQNRPGAEALFKKALVHFEEALAKNRAERVSFKHARAKKV